MRASYWFPLLILGLIGTLSVIACGGASGSVAQEAEAQAADVIATEAMGFIPSPKAGEHVGEEGTVRGSVKDYQYVSGKTGRPYILLFDVPGIVERGSSISDMETPQTFTVVVWKDFHKNFPSNFAAGYTGKTVCVTGMIGDYDGSPAIEVQDPSQLEIDC